MFQEANRSRYRLLGPRNLDRGPDTHDGDVSRPTVNFRSGCAALYEILQLLLPVHIAMHSIRCGLLLQL